MMLLPSFNANSGGNAFPIILAALVLSPGKVKLSGKVCNLAASRMVIPLSCSGWTNLPFEGV